MAVPVWVPFRFMALITHLVGLSTFLWSRTPIVTGCLDWNDGDPSAEQFKLKDLEIVVAFSISIVCCVIEIIGFVSGISLLSSLQCLNSILCHILAISALVYIVYGRLTCSIIWWIVSIFSITPAMIEVAFFITYLLFKRQT